MKNEREFVGTLLGFDDFVSKYIQIIHLFKFIYTRACLCFFIDMVIEDVTE